MIRAVPVEDANAFMVQCSFVAGSNAQGCSVVLIGEFGNITGNLTKDSMCLTQTELLNVTHPPSNYYEVFGFDIESDGSVETLAVPGEISWNVSEMCMSTRDQEIEPTEGELKVTYSKSDP